MYDLHTHSLLSDGQLLPSELVRRCKVLGYKGIAITDHIDASNIEIVLPKIVLVCKRLTISSGIIVIPGAELTHIPLMDMDGLVRQSRLLGAKLILVHGQTLSEPVIPGTNRKAISCDIDILAHPGLITPEEVRLAAKKGIYLEITTRRSHAYTNGHVAKLAKLIGAKLVLNSDSHAPEDLMPPIAAEKIALGAGLMNSDVLTMRKNAQRLINKLIR